MYILVKYWLYSQKHWSVKNLVVKNDLAIFGFLILLIVNYNTLGL